MHNNTNPDLNQAAALLTPETMSEVRKQPFSVQGWKILERWAANSPQKLQELEAQGTVPFLTRLLEQQQLETKILSEALDHPQGLASHEILSQAGVNTEL